MAAGVEIKLQIPGSNIQRSSKAQTEILGGLLL
jgi:hypothetical protein